MAPDFATDAFLTDARKRMVDSQIRPNKVSDARILEAMRRLPRERFLPPALFALAYADQNIVLSPGRVMMQAMVLARMVQALVPRKGEKALIIGSGCGYSAALLAALGCEVVALENSPALTEVAHPALAAFAPSVIQAAGPLPSGWAADAPYDLILIEGAVPAIPPALASQLNQTTGRLVAIVGDGGRTNQAVHAEPTPMGLSLHTLFDCLCPVLPGFAQAQAFEF